MKSKVIRILSIDGGGIRGLAGARVLEEIELTTGKRIYELFDVIVGTSTGGLISLLLTIPRRDGTITEASEVKDLYMERGHEIFASWWTFWSPMRRFFFVLFSILTFVVLVPFLCWFKILTSKVFRTRIRNFDLQVL